MDPPTGFVPPRCSRFAVLSSQLRSPRNISAPTDDWPIAYIRVATLSETHGHGLPRMCSWFEVFILGVRCCARVRTGNASKRAASIVCRTVLVGHRLKDR